MGLFTTKPAVSRENLSFSKQEMAAIIQLAGAMGAADGEVHPNELAMMANESNRFGISNEELKSLLDKASTMDGGAAIATIATMTDAQKRYVCAYLGALMAIDGEIDNKEMALWKLVSTLCKLPTMTIKDAITYMAN